MRAFCFNYWSGISPTDRLNDKRCFGKSPRKDISRRIDTVSFHLWPVTLVLARTVIWRWARLFWDAPENRIILQDFETVPKIDNGDKFCGDKLCRSQVTSFMTLSNVDAEHFLQVLQDFWTIPKIEERGQVWGDKLCRSHESNWKGTVPDMYILVLLDRKILQRK